MINLLKTIANPYHLNRSKFSDEQFKTLDSIRNQKFNNAPVIHSSDFRKLANPELTPMQIKRAFDLHHYCGDKKFEIAMKHNQTAEKLNLLSQLKDVDNKLFAKLADPNLPLENLKFIADNKHYLIPEVPISGKIPPNDPRRS